jgi:hypothetical protein
VIINLNEEMETRIKEDRRLRCFCISPEILPHVLCEGGSFRVKSGVPVDAVLASATYDYSKNMLVLMFWSGAWEPVEFGSVVPVLEIVMERLSPGRVLEEV